MNTSTKATARVVWVLSVLKWLAVVYWVVGGLVGMQLVWSATELPGTTLVYVAVVAAVLALASWAGIGWMQHVLGQLAVGNDRVIARGVYGGPAWTKAGESVDVQL